MFNILEGCFWSITAALFFWGLARLSAIPNSFRITLSVTLVFFGASDFVEAYYPVTFLEPGGTWLFVWKAFLVGMLILCLGWYLRIRLR